MSQLESEVESKDTASADRKRAEKPSDELIVVNYADGFLVGHSENASSKTCCPNPSDLTPSFVFLPEVHQRA